MENIKCPKCNKEVPSNANVCVACGTKVREKQTAPKSANDLKVEANANLVTAITFLAIGIVGIIIMFAYRAWLGGPIYILAAVLAYSDLKKSYEQDDTSTMGEFLKQCLSGKDLGRKIETIMVYALPIIAIIALYRWIVVDSIRGAMDMSRQIEDMFK